MVREPDSPMPLEMEHTVSVRSHMPGSVHGATNSMPS